MSGNEKDLATWKILISLERNMQINIYTMVKALQKKKNAWEIDQEEMK